MEMTEIRKQILAVANHMNNIEVRGKQNMTVLLSCQSYLEKLADEIMHTGEVDEDGSNA